MMGDTVTGAAPIPGTESTRADLGIELATCSGCEGLIFRAGELDLWEHMDDEGGSECPPEEGVE